jgi:hypothetical protein
VASSDGVGSCSGSRDLFSNPRARKWFVEEPALDTSWPESLRQATLVQGDLPDASDAPFWDNGGIGLITAGETAGRYIFVATGTWDERWTLGIATSNKQPGYVADGYFVGSRDDLRQLIMTWQVPWLPAGR